MYRFSGLVQRNEYKIELSKETYLFTIKINLRTCLIPTYREQPVL